MKVAIVDGYSTGATLARRLARAGADCVHVRSQPDIGAFLLRSFSPGDYVLDLGFTGDFTSLARELTHLRVARVVAGTETGVVLAETLASALGLPTNDPALVAARRDKSLMQQAVQAAGLATPQTTVARSARAAADWYAVWDLAEAVVKPLASAGTDGVTFCGSAEEVGQAATAVLGTVNLFGEPNDAVLVQERLRGTEYCVNTVSAGGEHHVAEIWRYTKRLGPSAAPIYDFQEPVDAAGTDGKVLVAYVREVLDALGITETPAHTEVMLTDRGPVLIETGARLGGGTGPDVVDAYLGVSQTALAVTATMDPASLHTRTTHDAGRQPVLRWVDFINHHPGPANPDALTKIAELPSVVAVFPGFAPRQYLAATTSLPTSPGFAYLAAPTSQELIEDYDTLRAWEREGIYTSCR
ncbi:ATP-grasp domain-containing protein [Streptomyces flavofungini]|uniref:ATP-grasp domain-containing protein n=1 Tax=Streptomyces flavofungini TaxID=68200 RepID=UPI0025AF4F2A|nr:ATP-grasp domain-containing protein [Streptomyces flavofungini]WJV44773.1 ATP-grasp domain-containing protein [Streptomyces flavofungini]